MLLSAFHKYEKLIDRVRFVGIHTGHLGFYTDYRDFEVDKLIENLKLDNGARVSYPILNVKVKMADGRVVEARALNEATIKRLSKTMVADIIINNVPFERFRGDGISVSTPTGSTAYNKSLGGAVLHPTIEALQIAEVASLNNRVYRTLGSSIVVPKKTRLLLNPSTVIAIQLLLIIRPMSMTTLKKLSTRLISIRFTLLPPQAILVFGIV